MLCVAGEWPLRLCAAARALRPLALALPRASPATAAGGPQPVGPSPEHTAAAYSSSTASAGTRQSGSGAGPTLPCPAAAYKALVVQAFDAYGASGGADPLAEELARRTLVYAQLIRGQRVLDVACGSGLILVPAGRAVGATGQVLGLDLSPGMVAAARAAIRKAGLRNVAAQGGDAELADLPHASYDVITCSSSLPYMTDPGAALARWRRWLRPGGRLVLNCFATPYDPETALFYDLATAHGLGGAVADPLRAVGSREACEALLQAAGYRRVQVAAESVEVQAPAASARAYAEAAWASSASAPHHQLDALGAGTAAAAGDAGGASGLGSSAAGKPGVADAAASGAHREGRSTGLAPAVRAAMASRGAALGPGGRTAQAPPPLKPPPLGAARVPRQQAGGAIGGTRHAKEGAAAVGHGVGDSGAARGGVGWLDSERLAAFRQAFLAAAEASAAKRLRSGAVRTHISVLFATAHA